jgi:hypothetical protein
MQHVISILIPVIILLAYYYEDVRSTPQFKNRRNL